MFIYVRLIKNKRKFLVAYFLLFTLSMFLIIFWFPTKNICSLSAITNHFQRPFCCLCRQFNFLKYRDKSHHTKRDILVFPNGISVKWTEQTRSEFELCSPVPRFMIVINSKNCHFEVLAKKLDLYNNAGKYIQFRRKRKYIESMWRGRSLSWRIGGY